MKRTAFVVGRRDQRSTTLVVLQVGGGPIHGPWTLRAVVSAN
jgi:hypothetical protein